MTELISLHIKDSCLITDIEDIKEKVVYYYENDILSHKRSVDSYVQEWHAHNWLFEHHLFRSHTRDVDLEFDICPIIEFGYWIIYKLFRD